MRKVTARMMTIQYGREECFKAVQGRSFDAVRISADWRITEAGGLVLRVKGNKV